MMKLFSKNKIKQKREEKRIAVLEKAGRIVDGVEVPENALAADPSKQNNSGGYSTIFYYQDIDFTCAGCGKEKVWTAKQQKRYYEEQKGNIYNQAKWCYDCHTARMQEKFGEE